MEALEDRVVLQGGGGPTPGGLNYWQAPPLQPGQTNAAWNADNNWSLGHKPTNLEGAVFDADHSTTPCLLTGAAAAPAAVRFQGNWTSTVTVDGGTSLTTPSLDLDARNAGGNELLINQNGQVEVTGTMMYYGGQVSGAGTLLVDRGATAYVKGLSAQDPPTLGCSLQIGAPDGSSAGYLWWTENTTNQPLVVTGNAGTTANAQGSIIIENQVPQPGQNFINAISNGDGGSETLTLNGGGIYCDNAHETFVGLGVTMTAGQITAGSQGPGPFHFTGINADGWGLEMIGGHIVDWTGLTFDQGAAFTGGSIQQQSAASTLTLGQAANSPASDMDDGDFQLTGRLVAHGGFTMHGGTMETSGSTASTIQLDAGNLFRMTGGTVTVTAANANNNNVTGVLTVNGNFEADSGDIAMQVNSSDGSSGLLQVNGNVTLGTGAIMPFSDVSQTPIARNWVGLFRWTGTRTGGMTVQPNGWNPLWGAGALSVAEPAP